MGIVLNTGTRSRSQTSSTIVKRRVEITDATLRLVAEDGLQGATMVRAGPASSISTAALYRYFESREAILMAAFDRLADEVLDWIRSMEDLDDIGQLRTVLSLHSDLFSSDIKRFNAPMYQFRVYLPDDRIRQHVGERTKGMIKAYEQMAERGKMRGGIRPDADSRSFVSDLLAWMYWESLTYLSGLDGADSSGGPKSIHEMLDRVLKRVAPRVQI